MDSKHYTLQFHHKGELSKYKYVGGVVYEKEKTVDADMISYSEIMDTIRTDMGYEKIGGVYVREGGEFKRFLNDKDVRNHVYLRDFDNGDIMTFFVDNVLGEHQEMMQMQPFVSVYPRVIPETANSPLRQSPKKSVKEKRVYVTLQSLQQQSQKLKQHNGNKKTCRDNQRDVALAEVQTDEVGESNNYDMEMARADTIKKNKEKMVALGIKQCLITPTEAEENTNVTNKQVKKGRKKKDGTMNMLPKRITRSVANISSTAANTETNVSGNTMSKDVEDLTDKDSTQIISKSAQQNPNVSKHVQHNPNVVKQLKQNLNEGIGTMEKFLEMRKRQTEGRELRDARMDAPEIEPEVQANSVQEINPPKVKKFRGQTRLDAIHTRRFEDRKTINLNEDKQPIADADKTLTEFSNFLGTLARQYIRVDHMNWTRVPGKDILWNFVQQKYIISKDGEPWVMKTIAAACRVYRCHLKRVHYKAYKNDDERRKHRPDSISALQFETLLQYWNDETVQENAEKNTENQKKVKDHHTCGPVPFSRIRKNLKVEMPNHVEPSKAQVYLATRKRKSGNKYIDVDGATQNKIARIEEGLSSGVENFEEILGEETSHSRTYLLGRLGSIKKAKDNAQSTPTVATSKDNNISDEALAAIKAEVREEFKGEMENTVQAKLAILVQRLSQLNPTLNLDVDEFLFPDTIDSTDSLSSDAH